MTPSPTPIPDLHPRAAAAPESLRSRRMSLLSRALLEELSSAHATLGGSIQSFAVRGPETGLVMLRGRIGGSGDAFNLGEATVTRATVRLSTGDIGHGQVLGTARDHARLAAFFDALWYDPAHRPLVDGLTQAIAARIEAAATVAAAETAATRVDFFTLVRGED